MQLGTMSWSLSPDDDGLEPVQSASLLEAPRPPERTLLGMPPPPPSRRRPSTNQTVVVDPESQVPSSPCFPEPDQLPIEPTVILKGRQVDRLRAQLLAQRRAYRKGYGRKLALWGVAGALAVALGAGAAAFALAPDGAAPDGAGPDGAGPDAGAQAAEGPSNGEVTEVVSPSRNFAAAHTEQMQVGGEETPTPAHTVAVADSAALPKRQLPARSPLLESGLEPDAVAAAQRSPLEESGLEDSEEMPSNAVSTRGAESEPAEEPEAVTLEELMRD